jgi:hypothetical protein
MRVVKTEMITEPVIWPSIISAIPLPRSLCQSSPWRCLPRALVRMQAKAGDRRWLLSGAPTPAARLRTAPSSAACVCAGGGAGRRETLVAAVYSRVPLLPLPASAATGRYREWTSGGGGHRWRWIWMRNDDLDAGWYSSCGCARHSDEEGHGPAAIAIFRSSSPGHRCSASSSHAFSRRETLVQLAPHPLLLPLPSILPCPSQSSLRFTRGSSRVRTFPVESPHASVRPPRARPPKPPLAVLSISVARRL